MCSGGCVCLPVAPDAGPHEAQNGDKVLDPLNLAGMITKPETVSGRKKLGSAVEGV